MTGTLFEGGIFALDPLSIDSFHPTCQVSTCYMVCNGKILVLKRNNRATAGGKWCMPGGKLEKEESAVEAVIREVKEETGILLLPKALALMQTICIRIFTPKQDFLLHLFKAVLPNAEPTDYSVTLNQEHTDYLWVNLQEAGKLNLVAGGNEVLEYLQTVSVQGNG